jgi:hypothetical protein
MTVKNASRDDAMFTVPKATRIVDAELDEAASWGELW